MKRITHYFLWSFLGAFLWMACARIGSPTGGPQDKTPPKVVRTTPPNGSTEFTGNRIRIYFDEFVTLKDVRKQLIISPPLKYFPEITPSGNAAKYIDIRLLDTLKENTTYTLNFGKSIQDNNEGNTLNFYTYTFSTGNSIDSLTLKGKITDALSAKADNYVNVMLYEVGEKFNDSVVYKELPTYVVNTLDSLTEFEFTHLRAGRYLLVAMKDKDNNYLFDPKTDKIGFHKELVTLPTDSTYLLTLFKEIPVTKTSRPFLSGEKRISIGYQGERDSIKVQPLPPYPTGFEWVMSKEPKRDTLWMWYQPQIEDSLNLQVSSGKQADIFKVNLRKIKPEELSINAERKSLSPTEELFTFVSNIPLRNFNKNAIHIIGKDSTQTVSFETDFTPNTTEATVKIAVKEGEKYTLTALSAFEDFYHQKSDTLEETFSAKKAEDFASLKVSLKGNIQYPILLELTDKDGKNVLYNQYIEQEAPFHSFPFAKAGIYRLRIIEDRNGNKKWDTGNFLLRKQPERIRYFTKEIELRNNWEVEQDITFEP